MYKSLTTFMSSLCLLFAICLNVQLAQAEAKKPNIILILVDDMGFSDLSCYGGEIPTPHLDGLAERGAKFSQFYNTARCCPTRAALLTGLYAHRAGVGAMTGNQNLPGYEGRINERSTTISEVLHDNGYFNVLTGKWHVGWKEGIHPWDRKFDRSLCIDAGGLHYSDQTGSRGNRTIYLNGEVVPKTDRRLFVNDKATEWYGTRLWTRYGLKFIDEAIEKDQPFFWYMPYVAPHFPCMAPEATVNKYRGKYMAGWDQAREVRIKRQRELGLIKTDWKLSAREDKVAAWESFDETRQKELDLIMAIYAAMMDEVDQAVGSMIQHLQAKNQLDNTLFLFVADNGSSTEGGTHGTFKVNAGARPGSGLSNIYVGSCWSNVNNTPFRKSKKFNHEGGIATPMIACWPKGIKANPDWIRTPAHVIDILPTLVDLTGSRYPEMRKGGHKVFAHDGVSLKPLLMDKVAMGEVAGQAASEVAIGKAAIASRPLYWEHMGNQAIRVGDRKLVKFAKGDWELYDIAKDRTELNNLAGKHPEEVESLARQWTQWAKDTGVLPRPQKKNKKARKKGQNEGKQ